jgi:polyphosphate kinase 2 (PPK2 family)
MRDIMSGAPSEEVTVLLSTLLRQQRSAAGDESNPDDELMPDWREGGYPYRNLMQRRNYERQKYRLQVELLKLQAWVKETGQNVVILFEGRDAAGKGGTIKRFMEHLNPRGAHASWRSKSRRSGARTVVFPALRAASADAMARSSCFDRSWYNRAGVERVMGFCSNEYQEFMRQVPEFERMLVRNGTHLFKFWFSVSREEQRRRFKDRARCTRSSSGSCRRSTWPRSTSGTDYTKRQGSHVLPHRYGRCAVDSDQVRLQEARTPQRHALRSAQAALYHQGYAADWQPRPPDCRSGQRCL